MADNSQIFAKQKQAPETKEEPASPTEPEETADPKVIAKYKEMLKKHSSWSESTLSDKEKQQMLILLAKWDPEFSSTTGNEKNQFVADIIKDKHNGILFTPGDPNDLNIKVKWILNNPEECKSIVSNAYNDFIENYTEENNYKKLIEVYQDAINSKNSRQF